MANDNIPITCPGCARTVEGQRNFCPYCGHTLHAAIPSTPEPLPDRPKIEQEAILTAPAPTGSKSKAPRSVKQQKKERRFRLFYPRALFGLFSLISLPLIVLMGWLLIRSRGVSPSSPPIACEAIDPAQFVASRFASGLAGEIEEDTLFSSGGEYLVQGTLVVPKNRRLLIQPGVRLIFEEGAGIEVQGSFYACGDSGQPITFSAEAGEPGSWQGIQFKTSSDDSVIAHALIQFAGDRVLYLEDSAPTLQDVKISSSSAFPISSDGSRMPIILENVEFDKNAFDGIEVRGGQIADRQQIAWPKTGFVYVVSGVVEVLANTALTIESETIVKFWHSGRGDAPGLLVRGLLKAEDVAFTSVYDSDDDVGGSTYVEARDPSPGDWAGIAFRESSGKSYLRQATIRYAGNGQGAIAMVASSPELVDVTIANGSWYPLSTDADSFPTFSNLSLRDNEPGDALEIRGDSAITGRQERTWGILGEADSQIVRVIHGNVIIEPEALLTIEPGVIIKFEPDGRLIVQGTLQATGGSGENDRIVFTSLRDDDYGGKTDKNTSPQDDRSWDGILFDKADDTSVLQNALVRYGSIAFNEASPRVIDTSIWNSDSAALWATPNSAPVLQGIDLQDNATNGLAIAGGEMNTDQVWGVLGEEDDQLIRILAGNIEIVRAATLQIEPGVIIKADSDGKLTVIGGLEVLGTNSNPVIFTSINDDSSGGDTNQKLQEARAGDWPGIDARADAVLVFGVATIRYAQTGLALHDGIAPDISGRLLVANGQRALWCNDRAEMPDTFIAEQNEDDYRRCPNE
jgi:hypothetical protein